MGEGTHVKSNKGCISKAAFAKVNPLMALRGESAVSNDRSKTPFSAFTLVNKPQGEIIFKLNLLKWKLSNIWKKIPKSERFRQIDLISENKDLLFLLLTPRTRNIKAT